MAKRKPRMLKCRMMNLDEIDPEELKRRTMKALATALYRSLSPEELDKLIYVLKKECNKNVS